MTNSAMTREKKLDNVIEGIRGRTINTSEQASNTPPAVLDLSVHKKKSESAEITQQQQSHPSDDITSTEGLSASDDPDSPLRPLDLTLQKQEPISVVTQDVMFTPFGFSKKTKESASSLFSTCIQTPSVDSSYFYTAAELKQAAPYVINLESPTAMVGISSPTQPNLFDTTLITPRTSSRINVGSYPYPCKDEIVSTIGAGSRNLPATPAAAVSQPRQTLPIPGYAPSALFAMTKTSPPSYSEAINSTLSSKQGLVTSVTCPTTASKNVTIANDNNNNNNNNREWTGNTFLDSTNNFINSDGRHISVLQIRPDFHSIKSLQQQQSTTPENFLFEGHDQKVSRSHGIPSNQSNFLLTEPVPFLSQSVPLTASQTSSLFSEDCKVKLKANTFASVDDNKAQKLRSQSPLTDSHSSSLTPPSLTSPATLTGSVLMPSLVPPTATASQIYSHATMSFPTVFMSQTSDGGMSNVLAIPVVQGLPEGFTNLKQFTFQPSSSSSSDKSDLPTAPLPSLPAKQALKVPEMTSTTDNFVLQKLCTMSNSTLSFPVSAGVKTSQIYANSIPSEPKKEWVRMRPGRPKGKTSKAGVSKKTQNKDMKLLTENSLFPGVYTSILKLPWSKRTRNKSKAKTDARANKCRMGAPEENTELKNINTFEESVLNADSGRPPSDLSQHTGDLVRDLAMETASVVKGDNVFQLQSQPIESQNQELEQQRRLHLQYQARLREEQQKMQKELVDTVNNPQIPCTSPTMRISPSPDNPYSTMSIKTELSDHSDVQSEIRHNVMLSSASIAAGQDPNVPNSQDPIMLVYPNIGPNGSKSKKRRGRPPKKPIGELKGQQESFLFPAESIFYPSDSMPDASFIHGNNQNLTFIPTIPSSVSQDLSLMSPTSIPNSFPCPEKQGTEMIKNPPNSSNDYINLPENEETTLEHKIIFLTNQIEMEMVRGNTQQTKELNSSCDMKDDRSQEQLSVQDYEPTSQCPTKPAEKPAQDGTKTRRKKTSRMLKSNENFIYATFRFKPRGGGTGGKKAKKKKRNNVTSLAANAETIANLRNKKLKGSESLTNQDKDATKMDSCVQSWKFHEQYPCTTSRSKGNNPLPIVSVVSCLNCGLSFIKTDISSNKQLCDTCVSQQHGQHFQDEDVRSDNNSQCNERFKTEEGETCDDSFMCEKESDNMTSCISCDKKIRKSLSGSSMQCDACMSNIHSLISSSKLFSISNTADISNSLIPKIERTSENTTVISLPDTITPPGTATGNILFCSLCRMQFTKISEYLRHIKDTHESTTTSSEETVSSHQASSTDHLKISTESIHRKVRSTLKTKKSLAHKTITCPVEDCPLFFRHKRDMDHHLQKIHGSNKSTTDSYSNFSDTNTNPANHTFVEANVNDLPSSPKTQLSKNSTLTLVSEENESSSSPIPKNEKPLCCSFCNFRCRQKNAMAWHMRKHPEAASQHRRYTNMSSE